MASLWLFNPENDLALGSGLSRYTAPAAARRLHESQALLPMWLAAEGDLIAAPQSLEPQARRLRDEYGLHGTLATPDTVAAVTACRPWGWSADAVGQLRRWGAPESALPDVATIERYRQLSHRRTSIAVNALLGVSPLPVEARSVDEALEAIASFGNRAFVKLPWSCSGRGVFSTERLQRQKLVEFIDAFIRKQGSVMVEKAHDRILDFAMLFYCRGGRARFHALSMFDSRPGGLYGGNLILPRHEIERRLEIDPAPLAAQAGEALGKAVAGDYEGPAGVDMMIAAAEDGGRYIVPCVEVNLRYTMGFIAAAKAAHGAT